MTLIQTELTSLMGTGDITSNIQIYHFKTTRNIIQQIWSVPSEAIHLCIVFFLATCVWYSAHKLLHFGGFHEERSPATVACLTTCCIGPRYNDIEPCLPCTPFRARAPISWIGFWWRLVLNVRQVVTRTSGHKALTYMRHEPLILISLTGFVSTTTTTTTTPPPPPPPTTTPPPQKNRYTEYHTEASIHKGRT